MTCARIVFAAAALALAGCTLLERMGAVEEGELESVAPPAMEFPAPVVEPEPPLPRERVIAREPRAAELNVLIAEFERVRRLPAGELAREQEATRQAFNQSKSDAARVRLAIALSAPGSPAGEELRALELLDPLVKSASAPLRGFAFLLASYIHEQRRLVAQVQGLQQNMQGLQQNVQTLQQNMHGLQQKLDALRTLERSLTERGEPAPRRR